MAMNLECFETAQSPVVIVGSVAYDNIETPFGKGERLLGGSATYASYAASYFAPTRLVGVVGNDFDPQHVALLEERGIDITGLQRDDSGPTFNWSGKYHENFHRRDTLSIALNVFENFRPALPSDWKDCPFVLLGNIHPELQAHVLSELDCDAPFVAADTIDLWIKTERDALEALLPKVGLFVINDSEAALLTDERNIITAGWKLLENGPGALIIKKGEHGALLFHPDGLFALPAYPVTNLKDPTGAGDAFAGALIGRLAARGSSGFAEIKDAMVWGTVAASLAVEAFSCEALRRGGADAIMERRDELLRIMTP